jgi:hypothetical protein
MDKVHERDQLQRQLQEIERIIDESEAKNVGFWSKSIN